MHIILQPRRRFLRQVLAGAMAGSIVARGSATDPNHAPNPMRTIVSEGFGRVVILGFNRGEKLLEGIRERLKGLGIKNAVLVSAIGTFEKARFHRITTTQPKPQDEIIEIEGPMELAAVDGIVADGEPHFHVVFQDMNRTYAAHLEDGCVVCYLAEVVLAEIRGVELVRVANQYGIRLLQKKN
ncbi:MAG: DNA-binding protein [Verrucomicrobiae bacterium]|nr:DNA-binding protein [Verrucomicrobiae bacterium]